MPRPDAGTAGRVRLGINIDHVATLRNARGGAHPDPVRAADIAADAGCDQITIHVREDRRHIRDADLARLTVWGRLPINLEMAASEEMLALALQHRPAWVCLVPERRQELTTEGGLEVAGQADRLAPIVQALRRAGIRVSTFIAPDPAQIAASAALGAQAVELHTGPYCAAAAAERGPLLARLAAGAVAAHEQGLGVHAGHGLDYASAGEVARLPHMAELNIGHFLVGEALFAGLGPVLGRMRAAIDRATGWPAAP